MRIGFFGGAFNPPTNAHINLANKALQTCKLDKVFLVPISDFYEKNDLANGIDRMNMLKIACSSYGKKEIEPSDIELKVPKKLYAIDAFRLIDSKYSKDDIFFIMGADNFIKLTNWKESDELIEKYRYIVFERGNIDLKAYINNDDNLRKCKIIIIQNNKYKENSSTQFRKSLNGITEQDIVSKQVYNYIIKNDLYRKK